MRAKRIERGFSLVELMVGMVIAILSSIIVYQVFAVSERQKRTTTGAADAQSNGAIAFDMLDRDIKMAGWGIEYSSFASCNVLYAYNSTTDAALDFDLFATVSITDGAGNPDTINIQYYDDPSNANYTISLTTLRSTMPQSSSELNVNSTNGCGLNSLAIVTQAGNCTLMEITQVQPSALKLQHNPGGSGMTYNPGVPYQNTNGWPAYTTGATLQCFPRLFRRTYRITNQALELQETDPKLATPTTTYQLVPNIIALEAQYGVAPANSQQVNEWVDATSPWASPLATTDIHRIKAVRIALVARSGEYEKPDAAGACTTTTTDMVDDWSTWATFDTTKFPTDWQCYRYKVFESIMPLRNVIWAKV